jgi:dCTP deaminase
VILSDYDIKILCQAGTLGIEPIADSDKQFQPASVDLRLGTDFIRVRKSHVGVIDVLKPEQEFDRIIADKTFVIEPGEFILASTIEKVTLPTNLVGRVDGRSSLGRLGLVIHVTAGFIDPGFSGHITLELTNLNPSPLRLHVGMRICQVSFHKMSSPAERPYGAARGSKYVGEFAEGANPSRIAHDTDSR